MAYPGTVLLVTHDRYLIREVADGLVVVRDGPWSPRRGGRGAPGAVRGNHRGGPGERSPAPAAARGPPAPSGGPVGRTRPRPVG